MTDKLFDRLPKSVYDLQTLSAEYSTIGSDLKSIIQQYGHPITTNQPIIDYFPDGPEITFNQATELKLSDKDGTNYFSLLYDPRHHFVLIQRYNQQVTHISSLLLPSQGEIQYSPETSIAFFDHLSRTDKPCIDPIKEPTAINKFCQEANKFLKQLQTADKVL